MVKSPALKLVMLKDKGFYLKKRILNFLMLNGIIGYVLYTSGM